MMDFLVRETRAVVVGPMVIIRYGTCGTPSPKIPVGSIAIASEGSVMVSTDYDAHDSTECVLFVLGSASRSDLFLSAQFHVPRVEARPI